MVRVSYNKELDVLYEQFIGRFTIDDLVEHHLSLGTNNNLPRKLNVLMDYRKAKFVLNIDDLGKLVQVISQNLRKYDYVKAAILHSEPYEQAISMIFESMVNDLTNFYMQIFTTKEAAIKWLLMYDVTSLRKKNLSKKKAEI